ncbi:NADPH-dependent F420 reductase [Candidatus Borrarchaeum sp.]|uniref:NADPH-dependent F420 reductase n=1 Tax=Candidatus Borrarchaeum sp. TaxID=2846742 RepID=UPI00257DC036|nr:NADPH-dependent F420 reductase [Candidatus Borrarchaeum sp.]
MKIGVIGGTGSHGGGLALRWAIAGENVAIGSRSLDKAIKAVNKYQDIVKVSSGKAIKLEGRENPDAAKDCDVVVLSVPYTSQVQMLHEIQPFMNPETILIDVSVPLEWKNGQPTPVAIPEGSCAERAASVLKDSDIIVIGAFKTIGAYSLRDVLIDLKGDVFLCGEDEDAKETVAQLVKKIKKLRPLDAGPLSSSRASELMVPLLINLNKRYKSKQAYIKVLNI